jgi:type IV pilus assembly protein PilB
MLFPLLADKKLFDREVLFLVIQKKRLGEILISAGILTEEQLEEGLEQQEETGQKLGESLVELGHIEGVELAAALSTQLNIPYVRLSDYRLGEELSNIIPETVARSRQIVPIEELDDQVVIAVADPLDIASVDEIKMTVGKDVEPVIAVIDEIEDALGDIYGSADQISGVIDQMTEDDVDFVSDSGPDLGQNVEEMVNETPVIKLVNMILLEAIKNKASDIHLEPFEHRFIVRIRLDGVLQELNPPPKELQHAVISRIKVMADLDIAETRLPQDGRIRLKLAGQELDFRVSTLPTVFGESVVLRLLSQEDIALETDAMGFQPDVEEKFRDVLSRPNGIILITGPTGCGKTTTLYAGINHINDPEDKIITMEDPVEYEVGGLIQCQVNEKVGFTFASGLRAILRQDPDICLIGEIRDVETAEIAVQASLTGHLVLSTTHTNEAAGAITRLVDMGVQPFLLTTTIQVVVAQRLVRLICENCREEYEPDPDDLQSLGKSPADYEDLTFTHGVGCEKCGGTGFKGRTGIFEMLEMTEAISDMITEKAPANLINQKAIEEGMVPMREDGWIKIVDGMTTVEEVLRVAPVDSGVSVDISELDIDEELASYL